MFLATLPNLGLTDSADMELGGHGRKVIVLIKKRSNINILLARLNQRRDKNKESSRYDGLTTFKGFNVTGLTRTETYFFADGDVVSNLLTCDPPGSVASPSCTHLMLHGEFLIQANYGRDWLPKWHDIHALLVEAIDRCDIP